ncbi:hypothetical protein DL93DRAFT_1865577 [Clavulina sp. PMI_390]|nr:hypothetical protein DL93DRAFT_1865577 [Clavulina sp. PMI_390]
MIPPPTAHACPRCHRRFSVPSNMRRHRLSCGVKKTKQGFVNVTMTPGEPGTSTRAEKFEASSGNRSNVRGVMGTFRVDGPSWDVDDSRIDEEDENDDGERDVEDDAEGEADPDTAGASPVEPPARKRAASSAKGKGRAVDDDATVEKSARRPRKSSAKDDAATGARTKGKTAGARVLPASLANLQPMDGTGSFRGISSQQPHPGQIDAGPSSAYSYPPPHLDHAQHPPYLPQQHPQPQQYDYAHSPSVAFASVPSSGPALPPHGHPSQPQPQHAHFQHAPGTYYDQPQNQNQHEFVPQMHSHPHLPPEAGPSYPPRYEEPTPNGTYSSVQPFHQQAPSTSHGALPGVRSQSHPSIPQHPQVEHPNHLQTPAPQRAESFPTVAPTSPTTATALTVRGNGTPRGQGRRARSSTGAAASKSQKSVRCFGVPWLPQSLLGCTNAALLTSSGPYRWWTDKPTLAKSGIGISFPFAGLLGMGQGEGGRDAAAEQQQSSSSIHFVHQRWDENGDGHQVWDAPTGNGANGDMADALTSPTSATSPTIARRDPSSRSASSSLSPPPPLPHERQSPPDASGRPGSMNENCHPLPHEDDANALALVRRPSPIVSVPLPPVRPYGEDNRKAVLLIQPSLSSAKKLLMLRASSASSSSPSPPNSPNHPSSSGNGGKAWRRKRTRLRALGLLSKADRIQLINFRKAAVQAAKKNERSLEQNGLLHADGTNDSLRLAPLQVRDSWSARGGNTNATANVLHAGQNPQYLASLPSAEQQRAAFSNQGSFSSSLYGPQYQHHQQHPEIHSNGFTGQRPQTDESWSMVQQQIHHQPAYTSQAGPSTSAPQPHYPPSSATTPYAHYDYHLQQSTHPAHALSSESISNASYASSTTTVHSSPAPVTPQAIYADMTNSGGAVHNPAFGTVHIMPSNNTSLSAAQIGSAIEQARRAETANDMGLASPEDEDEEQEDGTDLDGDVEEDLDDDLVRELELTVTMDEHNLLTAWEERDSFDPLVPLQPYLATNWRDRLPGPAPMAVDVLVKDTTRARRWML